MKRQILFLVLMIATSVPCLCQNILIEAESFSDKGGWLVDPQFVEQMGSPYLLAHGMGQPVKNAETSFTNKKRGEYHVWVRTKNWIPGNWDAPGTFHIQIDNHLFPEKLGTAADWNWQYAGSLKINKGIHEMILKDLTGFEGRCDAVYLSLEKNSPPDSGDELAEWRRKTSGQLNSPEDIRKFDLVITGGGIAGCAASIAAAEQGLNVALIHDRPVLGGNSSSEIRVHTLGIYGHYERILKMLDTEHYPNGSPEAKKEDKKRMNNIRKYDNITLFLNWRAYNAHAENNVIKYVDAKHTSSGEILRFEAPIFVDCTGDGWIGYWAGAEYSYGRESVNKYKEEWERHGERWSPEKEDNRIMGSSILWRSYLVDSTVIFPEVPWAMDVAGDHSARNGEWQWEMSRNDLHQIDDGEKIRDHMFRAIYGSFYNEKQKPHNEKLALLWVSYLLGKRESRRLVGDHIYTLNDARNQVKFPDSVVVEEREVDVHYQKNLMDSEEPDFMSEALFYKVGRYYVPYRSLYSKNVSNLFMAGRCFSCSHIGLGGPRVMRTTGQMGASVGYAASICKKYNVNPRDVYQKYLKEYMELVLNSDKPL